MDKSDRARKLVRRLGRSFAGRRARSPNFRAGRLPVDQLLTHRLKLEDINGFDRLPEGIGVRQVIAFD